MKNIFVITSVLCLVIIFVTTGCSKVNETVVDVQNSQIVNSKESIGSNEKEEENIINAETNLQEEIFEDPVDLISFSSLEEFDSYLKIAEKGGDVADLSSLKKYHLPTAIPEGYKLYKITAGINDIGFWYLPESYLDSEDKFLSGESSQQHFLFISTRNSLDMEGIKAQFNINNDDLINNSYYVHESSTSIVFWEQEGDVLMLYLPVDISSKYNNRDGISTLCKSKVVNIEEQNDIVD
jgi:hypothetical protein